MLVFTDATAGNVAVLFGKIDAKEKEWYEEERKRERGFNFLQMFTLVVVFVHFFQSHNLLF